MCIICIYLKEHIEQIFVPSFEQNLLEFNYEVTNNMKESELGIYFVQTINKNMFREIFLCIHQRQSSI